MDQNENTKNGPGQPQNPELPESDKPKAGLDNMPEPARKCQVCGSPNHYGCGCEAKARREKKVLNDLPKLHYLIGGRSLCVAAKPGEKSTEIQYEVTCPECIILLAKDAFEQPAAKMKLPEEIDDMLEDVLSIPAIRKMHDAQMDSYKNIEKMANGIEGLCELMYERNNFLKVIASDLITIRNFILKEKEIRDIQLKDEKEKNAAEGN